MILTIYFTETFFILLKISADSLQFINCDIQSFKIRNFTSANFPDGSIFRSNQCFCLLENLRWSTTFCKFIVIGKGWVKWWKENFCNISDEMGKGNLLFLKLKNFKNNRMKFKEEKNIVKMSKLKYWSIKT